MKLFGRYVLRRGRKLYSEVTQYLRKIMTRKRFITPAIRSDSRFYLNLGKWKFKKNYFSLKWSLRNFDFSFSKRHLHMRFVVAKNACDSDSGLADEVKNRCILYVSHSEGYMIKIANFWSVFVTNFASVIRLY